MNIQVLLERILCSSCQLHFGGHALVQLAELSHSAWMSPIQSSLINILEGQSRWRLFMSQKDKKKGIQVNKVSFMRHVLRTGWIQEVKKRGDKSCWISTEGLITEGRKRALHCVSHIAASVPLLCPLVGYLNPSLQYTLSLPVVQSQKTTFPCELATHPPRPAHKTCCIKDVNAWEKDRQREVIPCDTASLHVGHTHEEDSSPRRPGYALTFLLPPILCIPTTSLLGLAPSPLYVKP